jgi:hypothetical protein
MASRFFCYETLKAIVYDKTRSHLKFSEVRGIIVTSFKKVRVCILLLVLGKSET